MQSPNTTETTIISSSISAVIGAMLGWFSKLIVSLVTGVHPVISAPQKAQEKSWEIAMDMLEKLEEEVRRLRERVEQQEILIGELRAELASCDHSCKNA